MALDDLPDEHEQSERVRDWLRNNAFGLIGGLVLGLSVIGGWKWWQNHQHQQRMQVSEAYHAVLDSIGAGDLDKAASQAQGLKDSAYASILALDLAKAQLDAGQRDDAIATLRAANSREPGLEAVVQQRLARLLIDAGNAEEAIALLADAGDAASLETRGDARFALGRTDEAREDYAAALRQLDVAAPQRQLLELKFAEVGGQPDASEAQS